MTTKDEVNDALNVISKYSNAMGNKDLADIMTEFMRNEHRTLQQCMMKDFIQLIVNYSKFGTDDRNISTVKTCIGIKNYLSNNDELFYDDKYLAPFI